MYGFRGIYSNLLKSNLKFCRQKVLIYNQMSEVKAVQFGAPQGSILGHLLYNIYIKNIIHNLSFMLTTLAYILLQPMLNTRTTFNSLTINTSKSKAMLLRPKNCEDNRRLILYPQYNAPD